MFPSGELSSTCTATIYHSLVNAYHKAGNNELIELDRVVTETEQLAAKPRATRQQAGLGDSS